jgi:hypothetical protein
MDEQTISNEIGQSLMRLYELLECVADGKLSWEVKDFEYSMSWAQNKMAIVPLGKIWHSSRRICVRLSYLKQTKHYSSLCMDADGVSRGLAFLIMQWVGSHVSALSKRLKSQYPTLEYATISQYESELQYSFVINAVNVVFHLSNKSFLLNVNRDSDSESIVNRGKDRSYECYTLSVVVDKASLLVCKFAVKIMTLNLYECTIAFNSFFSYENDIPCVEAIGTPEMMMHVVAPPIYDWTRNLIKNAGFVHEKQIRRFVDSFFVPDVTLSEPQEHLKVKG